MLIVPIGRENAVVRRHAWVTYSILALNFAMFVLVCLGSSDRQSFELIQSWRETIAYLRDRPYLRIPASSRDLMPHDLRDRTALSDPTVDDWETGRQQKEANELGAELRKRYEASPEIRLAYVPAAGSIPSIFTSMFLHAGWMHLLGNMLFLFVTAPFIEDVYGRPLFLILYLTGGAVATLSFAARDPNSVIPLVGASGAIAAVMGAYLLRFFRSRLEFLCIPILFVPHWSFRFFVPAFVVLPLWFLDQLVSIPAESNTGVAVTAHVAGFAYGFAVALFLKLTRIEERFISRAIDRQVSWTADPRLERALEAFRLGNLDLARNNVSTLLDAQPNHPDTLRLALDVALARNDTSSIDNLATRLLALNTEDRSLTMDLIREITEETPTRRLPRFLAQAASRLERLGDRDAAIALYERLATFDESVPTLVKLANARRAGGDLFAARETFRRALEHPKCSDEWRRRISNTLELMASDSAGVR